MAGKISWQLSLDGSDNVIRQLREIDRLFASINRNSRGFGGGGNGGTGTGGTGGGFGGGGGGRGGWPLIMISGGGGGSVPALPPGSGLPATVQKPGMYGVAGYKGPVPGTQMNVAASGSLPGFYAAWLSNWSKAPANPAAATGSPTSNYLANQASKRPWDVAMAQYSQHLASFTGQTASKPTLMDMLKNNLFGKTTDMSQMMGLDSTKFIKDMLNIQSGTKGVPAWLKWNAIPGKTLPMVPGAASASSPLTLTNLGTSFGAQGSGIAGGGVPPIIPPAAGGGGSGGHGGGWKDFFKLDELAKHFLKLFSMIKLVEMAFRFLKHAIEQNAALYRTSAMTGQSLRNVAGATTALGAIGIGPDEARTLMLNAQFRKGSQESLSDTMLGAGRSVGSKGLIQQIQNLKPYLDLWEQRMGYLDHVLSQNAKTVFDLGFVWARFKGSFESIASDLAASIGPKLIFILGALATSFKVLAMALHGLVHFDPINAMLNKTNKFLGFVPKDVPEFKQGAGYKPGNTNLSGWERMGLVIGSGRGDHLSEIAKNTKETATHLKQLVKGAATGGWQFRPTFNMR